jgi:hypothetical protein
MTQVILQQESLLATCALPGCVTLVGEEGEACSECRTFWGPYLVRQGEPSVWQPTQVPACGHGLWWFRGGKCDQCGNTAMEAAQ